MFNKLSISWTLFYILPGIFSSGYSYFRIISYLYNELSKCESTEISNFYPARHFEVSPKIVVIGGGTGLSTLLRGIKKYGRLHDKQNVTAVVTVMDDGGSSGKLRREYNLLPPGDIRNCLVSLANEETMLANLFKYRFKGEGELSGHSFGNLFIAALTDITGDFEKAIEVASKILAVKGQILPASLSLHTLKAELINGKIITGESNIGKIKGKLIKKLFLDPPGVKPNHKVLQAISEADCIVLGPGSLFTSIIPNLLVPQIKETIKESKAIKIYICNIMTQPKETDDFKASDHVKEIIKYLGGNKYLDYVIINSKYGSKKILEKYASEGAYPVEIDYKNLDKLGISIILEDLMEQKNYLRHNFKALSRLILNLVVKHVFR